MRGDQPGKQTPKGQFWKKKRNDFPALTVVYSALTVTWKNLLCLPELIDDVSKAKCRKEACPQALPVCTLGGGSAPGGGAVREVRLGGALL